MKTARIALLLASSALFAACALCPMQATGPVIDAHTYVYGDSTVLEFDANPAFLSIRDSSGAAVAFEKVGRHTFLLAAWIRSQLGKTASP